MSNKSKQIKDKDEIKTAQTLAMDCVCMHRRSE